MKKLEKERQTAIDEKKSRLADMHQAQLERMEKEKINPVIQAYQKNKTVFQSKVQDTRDYVDSVLKQLDQVSYENDSKEVIDERTEVEKMRGELSKFKEMFGQTIKNLTPIITEQAEARSRERYLEVVVVRLSSLVWTILISVLDFMVQCFVMTNTHKSIDMLTMI